MSMGGRSFMVGRGGGEATGKDAPHARANAQPWTKFKGKQVGRKEVSLLTVHRPGHKANAALEEPTASGAYGGFYDNGRAPVVQISRKQFGAFSLSHDQRHPHDSLGPVDLEAERHHHQFVSQLPRKKGAQETVDTLRWNGQSEGGRGALAAAVRRKAAAAAEEEAKQVAAASRAEGSHVRPDATATSRPPPKELTAPIGYENVARSEKALRYEEALRVRTQLEQQTAEEAAAVQRDHEAASARDGRAEFFHPALRDKEKVAALSNPKVQAALDAALNGPNRLAFEQHRARNTQRLSAERKY